MSTDDDFERSDPSNSEQIDLTLAAFTREFDAFTQIDDVEFNALISITGRLLTAVNHEVYLLNEDPSIINGALELRFGDGSIIQVTDAHSGARIYPNKIHSQPEDSSKPSEIQVLSNAEIAIGKTCVDVLVGLERARLCGNEYLTSAFVFDFQSIKIGYENFFELYGQERSQIVVDPNWKNCKLVSLVSGKTHE